MTQTRNKVIPACRILILIKGFTTLMHISLHTNRVWKKVTFQTEYNGLAGNVHPEQAMRHRWAEQV